MSKVPAHIIHNIVKQVILLILICVSYPLQSVAQEEKLCNINAWNFSSVTSAFKKKSPNTNVIALTTSITKENGFTEQNANFISSKVDSVVNSLGLKHPMYSRYVVTAKLDTLSFDNYAQRYGTDLFSGKLRLFVFDILNKQIISSCEYRLRAKTVGIDSCIVSALSQVDFETEELRNCLKSSIDIINQNYNTEIAKVWRRYKTYADREIINTHRLDAQTIKESNKSIDKDISFFLSVPTNHPQYATCLNYAAYVSLLKGEFNNKQYLVNGEYCIGWEWSESEKETLKWNQSAVKSFNKIPKWSVYYQDALSGIKNAKAAISAKHQHELEHRKMEDSWDDYVKDKIREVGGDPNPKPVQIQSNTAGGMFILGVLATAWVLCPPAVAAERYVTVPVSLIRALLAK